LGDLLEAQKSGVRTIAVSWGFHGENRLKKGSPDLLIHGFDELCGAVEEVKNIIK
jgi:phosphoglycolate phosphatase-like HAD superfamily hydrolase